MSALRRCGLFLLGLTLPLLAVASRNAALGGGFLPTTSQGGVNFWIGNNPAADGTYRPLVPGKQVPAYEREGARILAEQAAKRDALFAQSFEAEKNKGDALSKRFEEALKEAKKTPASKPLRGFDLD